ncbi:hypothetical protein A9W98_19315 [Mycobacterium gordonae]|jgi:hypothetical protein|uniref:Uncharacterized protein n=1 Tax=Mycobacterium gordonae TaxID=1778 RepID=A0A1A6BH40_MYCGO|nr:MULTISPECIES: hypothetical protein [Mycobacterium]MBI2697657.1 hypothetical protein [Mycobacterium sp.]OBS01611.1 hypothetical protein A9W98_19315 [Mycobacterium gordonae]PJE08479.1 MAG: hypothetical protein CK428_19955 [Mycobacterium sp.]
MKMQKLIGTALMAGALGAGALGVGAGTAAAKPGPNIPGPPGPPVPVIDNNWRPAPGQIKQFCPWQSPPGQWIGGPHGIPCT